MRVVDGLGGLASLRLNPMAPYWLRGKGCVYNAGGRIFSERAMTPDKRFRRFERDYDVLAFDMYGRGPERRVRVGSGCRFCGMDREKTSFRNVAHAIPEAYGNRQLITADECDRCNELFSNTIENHLDKYSKPFRVIGQIPGKAGVPSYRTNDKRERIDFSDKMSFRAQHDGELITLGDDLNTVHVDMRREPYSPQGVYLALIKIGLSILDSPEEFEPFRATARWLTTPLVEPIQTPSQIWRSFIPGPRPINGVFVAFLRRKPTLSEVPYALFVLAFGNISLQVDMPSVFDPASRTRATKLHFPTRFELENPEHPGIQRFVEDFTSPQVRIGDMQGITMHSDSMEKLTPPD